MPYSFIKLHPLACGYRAEVVARVLNVDSGGILSCVCGIRDIHINYGTRKVYNR